MSRLTRDGTAEPVSRDQILRYECRQGKKKFPCSVDHEQDWQPYTVDPYFCYMCDHTQAHDLSLGLRYGEAKRREYDHYYLHHLPQLLGGLRDDSGIVRVKHATKQCRQDWLSGGCFPPPPRPPAPFFFLTCTKASITSLSALKYV